MYQKLPQELLSLISYLKKLPGVGGKTAERFAFELLKWPQGQISEFATILDRILEKLPPCKICGCIMDSSLCTFCHPSRETSHQLCIISSQKEVYTIEQTKSYHGLYHVIKHLLSPLEGKHAEDLDTAAIEKRIHDLQIKEVILAFDSTLEGDTTALYLKEKLSLLPISISRLAFGIPIGSSLDYIDGGTLTRAFKGRQTF